MKRIKVNTDHLYAEARGFMRHGERLGAIGHELYEAFHAIEIEYSGLNRLSSLIINEFQQAGQLSSRLEALAGYLKRSAEALDEADRTAAAGLIYIERMDMCIGRKFADPRVLPVTPLPWLIKIINPPVHAQPLKGSAEGTAPGWPDNAAYTGQENPFAKSGHGGQCTSFVWGRVKEKLGISLPFRKSAKYWWEDKKGLNFGSTPKPNAIAVWAGDSANPYGHVGFVESVSGNSITFNEANVSTYNGSAFGGGYDGEPKTLEISRFEHRGKGVGKLLGYIYLD